MFSRLTAACLVVGFLIAPAWAKDKQAPPKEEEHYARAEIRGKLTRMGDKEKIWAVVVGGQKEGEGAFYCPLIIESKELEREAKRLKDKTVLVTGDMLANGSFPGVGGESFLFLPGPNIVVRTLKAAGKK